VYDSLAISVRKHTELWATSDSGCTQLVQYFNHKESFGFTTDDTFFSGILYREWLAQHIITEMACMKKIIACMIQEM